MELKKSLVDYFPLFSSMLIEYGNMSQLYKMWTAHTAAGQNIYGYFTVMLALLLWVIFYRLRLPGNKIAFYVTCFGVGSMLAIMTTIWHFSTWPGR